MQRRRKFLVADLLCGAGGSSTGCAQALAELGLTMELVCLNHWPIAIETHKLNHPEARHYCQDISTVRPHIIVPEGYLDLLMASPTCTHHSVARGGKPTSDQQRSDPWHIITWLTELRVKRMIIENVWEFIGWGPVDPRTGKPIKARKGEYFRAWIETIRRLGFEPEWHKLNAADYGDATTRQRFILMARSDSRSISWPIPTHRKREVGKLELFPGLHPWRPARDIIDWKIKGRSIFNRKKPLAPKTLARIYAGAVKFQWPEPFLVILRNHMAGQSVDSPLPTIAANGTHIALAQPILVKQNFRRDAQSVDEPAPTIMTQARIGVAEPVIVRTDMHKSNAQCMRGADDPLATVTTKGGMAVAEPVIINGRKNNQAKGVSTDPVPTLDTKGGVWLAQPVEAIPSFEDWYAKTKDLGGTREEYDRLYLDPDEYGRKYYPDDYPEPFVMATGSSGAPRPADEPLPTITTGGAGSEDPGCARPMLVEPFILNRHGENGATRAHSVEEPTPTANCDGGGYLVEPFILSQASGGSPRKTDEPVPTIPCDGAHALISPYYSNGGRIEMPHSAEEPLPAVTSKGRFGVVVPVTNSGGGPGPRSVDEPVPTMTTAKGGEFAIVVPITHEGGLDRVLDANNDPLPTVTGANRGELAFIAAQFGEREGQPPRVHAIDEPTPAICATGHINLIEATQQYDILFRMLEPHELAAAMGFSTDDVPYEFAGTKTEQIKQIGNAVSVAKMRACVRAIASDAAQVNRAAPLPRDKAVNA